MLVLSRRQGQRILFPQLNILVQVLPGKRSVVRLGIEAPADVSIVRDELAVPDVARPPVTKASPPGRDLHGRLQTLALTLAAAEEQLGAGLTSDADRTLRKAQTFLKDLRQTLTRPAPLEQAHAS